MHNILKFLVAFSAVLLFPPLSARSAVKSPPFEIVKLHIDVQTMGDGSYVETREAAYRLLSEASVQALHQIGLSYTEGYQQLDIMTAYTLKANGTRLDVEPRGILKGYGATSSPGFRDIKTVNVVFPNVEVGDQVVITSVFRQLKPWFRNKFSGEYVFPPEIRTLDAEVSIASPESTPLQIDNIGLQGGEAETGGGMVRRTWHYHNENAATREYSAVSSFDIGPRLIVSTFSGYPEIAELYRQLMHGKADVTPEIKEQAEKLVAGIADRREQAHAIYDWVSRHIAYVNIVLGAGGFVPHEAGQILQTKYGDCKDHVVMLTALLAAVGIVSVPVLIDATDRYRLPSAASPLVFNHLINYLPEFHLFADSTARYAPFGQLPPGDSGKAVANVATATIDHTPVLSAADSTIRSQETATVDPDGTLEGDTKVTATGSFAMVTRSTYALLNDSIEAAFLGRALGPGASGSFDKGNLDALSDPYTYAVHFRVANALNMPGPAATSASIGFEPFYPVSMIGEDLPPSRDSPYVCPSVNAENDLTLHFPKGIRFTNVPASSKFTTEGVALNVTYQQSVAGTLHILTTLKMDHPAPTCDPSYYARVRPKLASMIAALRAQIVYQLPVRK